MNRMRLAAAACWLAIALLVAPVAVAGAVTGEALWVPMELKEPLGRRVAHLKATLYRPAGPGPFPLIVVTHGSPRDAGGRPRYSAHFDAQAEQLVAMGFAVAGLLRRGYGDSSGTWAEGYGSCAHPDYYAAGMATAEDMLAAVRYLQRQPWVDAGRVVLAGKSAGGFGALAAASLRPAGVRAVINIAGGRGSRAPGEVCGEDRLVETFARYAATTELPQLWIYAQNDGFFGPQLARRFEQAYQAAGRDVTFVAVPAYGRDGHRIFDEPDSTHLWLPAVREFLLQTGIAPARNLQRAFRNGPGPAN